MNIVAVSNHKGGCGKTTTSINFAACLAHLQKKVLLLDLDPQGHSTCGLGVKAEESAYTLYDILHPPVPHFDLTEAIIKAQENLYLIPTYGILGAIEEEFGLASDKEELLKKKLIEPLREQLGFDYIILDCPPNLGTLTYNALEVADEVIIPIEPSYFSLHGLGKMMETLQVIEERRSQQLNVHALLTIFNSKVSFSEEIYDEVKEHFGEKMFKSIIHDDVAFKEAAAAGQSILEYDRHSSAFQDYLNLATEYLEREWTRQYPEKDLGWEAIFLNRFGPKKVPGGVLFQMISKSAKSVEIAGDFNQWVPEPMVLRDSNGLWQKIVPIQEKRIHYKFIVDGEWQVDPYQPTKSNQFGSSDSCLEIA